MGAKTTTFINDVTNLTTACQAPLTNLVTAAAAFKVEKDAFGAVVAQSAARVTLLTNDLQWSAGGAPPKHAVACGGQSSEDYISNDPTFRQLDIQMNAHLGRLQATMAAVEPARNALRPHYVALEGKVTAFAEYVKAKKKSTINPFKKKSVGRAEKVISRASALLASMKLAAKSN